MSGYYILDAFNLIFRAFHVAPALTSPDGIPTGALTVFTKMVHALRRDRQPDHILAVFDSGGRGGRNEIYPAYKAHRPEHDAVDIQIPLIRAAVMALGIATLDHPDYEADDLIATYARAAASEGHRVVIVSGDKDLMQVCSESVWHLNTGTTPHRMSGPAEVEAKFGVAPHLLGDLLALMGDKSDNVPGVKGIGPKTAAELLAQHGDLEGVLAAAPYMKHPKRKERLIEHAGDARMSRRLVELQVTPMAMPLDAAVDHGYSIPVITAFFAPLGMFNTISMLELEQRRQVNGTKP